ncbi:MAG: hypothetical protein J6C07_08020 [Lachnospiraceae bacterium]|nr:hypothetical protein [Lachnospiraceae bacterium]
MIKMIKAIWNKYNWGMLGMLIGLGIVDIINKNEFEWSAWIIRIIVMLVMFFITGAIEYKNGKLK